MSLSDIVTWLVGLEWSRLVPEILGKGLGFLLGFAVSWYFIFRKRIKDLQKFQHGDSDDVLFQVHYLLDVNAGQFQLVFRNVTTKLTVKNLYDNPAARDLAKSLTDGTTLNDPILPTHGTLGFELVNDAANYVCGSLATTPHPKSVWLMCMTCEDRAVVRRRCIRCFLIRPGDLEKFTDWKWASTYVRLEKPWHWFRIVALHRIARMWLSENVRFSRIERDDTMPLVDDHAEHRRIVKLSLGLSETELAVAEPYAVDWSQHAAALSTWQVELENSELASRL